MKKLLLIDGNSIMNRAFYGIMGSKILTNQDGKYTNALYGFLAILFKNFEEVNPDYAVVAFDSKTAADVRKKKYEGYKKNRHKMPEELAEQMPEIKVILKAMNIQTLELADFEGDDIIGSFAKKFASKEDVEVYILSGDRDLFQLIQSNITVRIPRTKMGKTETEIYDKQKVMDEYGLEPKDLIELKALMGDSSDEIPGAPGVGPKTATTLLQKFKTIEGIYDAIEKKEYEKDFKPKVKESLQQNKQLVEISKDLGRINIFAPITDNIDDIKLQEWNKNEVYDLFKYYGFNRYIDRFKLSPNNEQQIDENQIIENEIKNIKVINKKLNELNIEDELIFYIEKENIEDETKIIKKKITGIGIYEKNQESKSIKNNQNIEEKANESDEKKIANKNNKIEEEKDYRDNNDGIEIAYIKNPTIEDLKQLFENNKTKKIGYNLSEDYVILRENGIKLSNIGYDIEVAAYDIDPTKIKHSIGEIAMQFMGIDLSESIPQKQINLFEDSSNSNEIGIYVYAIKKIYEITSKKLEEEKVKKLFDEIEIPLITVLGEIQFVGMHAEKEELINFGLTLKTQLEELTKQIYELAGEEFNINSTQQLGNILFEKMNLPAPKKNKKGYSTDVDTLEKIKMANPIVEKILEYRGLMKLNSTYVEGLIPYINPKTERIHSYFHQTITATGRISSTEPNLQNIPSRDELGRNIKKAFKPANGYVYIDADYSQIELRVLASMSKDENMMNAFKNDEDIHREVASRVFGIPFDEVTKEQRSRAKAVNFGIVYGITGFGLAEQIGIGRKEAQTYIDSYLEKYSGIKSYMNDTIEKAKETGYVETLFGRRRYIQELKSSNYMVREFGKRAAMNTPIQGTAADIMKIAMNNVYAKLNESGLDAKIVLQVHDELILEVKEEQKEAAKNILKDCMENATKLEIPLKVEISEAKTWYDAK